MLAKRCLRLEPLEDRRMLAAGDFIDAFVANGSGIQYWFALDSEGDLYVSGSDLRKFDGETGALITRFGVVGGKIAVGPDDNLYRLSNDRVTRYDSDTGQVMDEFVPPDAHIDRYGGNLVFGPDDNLYICTGSGMGDPYKVLRYDGTTGAFINVFVPSGSGGLQQPWDMTFGSDGNLYVSSAGGNIKRYRGTTGAYLGNFIPGGSGGLTSWGGVAFGPDGHLYVTDRPGHAVLRYHGTTGAFLGEFVREATSGLTGEPWDLVFMPDGDLLVTGGLPYISQFDGTTGQPIGEFANDESGGLGSAMGILFDPDGNLLVSSRSTDEVLRYDGTTGAFLDTFISTGSGGLDVPRELAYGPDGSLFVSSWNTHEVLRYDSTSGEFLGRFVTAGRGGLGSPFGLTFGTNGDLYVCSANTDEVLHYNGETGAFVRSFVTSGNGGLDFPFGLAFGPDGSLYVSSLQTDEVLRYDGTTGAFLGGFVAAGSGGLDFPTGLVFGPDNSLYVVSEGSNAVLSYDGATGEFLGEFVAHGSGGLTSPSFLAFGPDGNLYVATMTKQVLRYEGPFSGSRAAGALFDDQNRNEVRDAGEMGLAGWTVRLELTVGDAVTVVTDAVGGYVFHELEPGQYVLSVDVQAGFTQTTPAGDGTHTITITAEEPHDGLDFGIVLAGATPVAVDDTYAVDEDMPLVATTEGVLANDTDADGDPLTATLLVGPSHGQLTFNPNGLFAYAPEPNYHGPDSFTYLANDGVVDSNVATVTITVRSVNDVPLATDDAYTVATGGWLSIDPAGVLANDTDADQETLTAVLVDGPTHGQSFLLGETGSFVYIPKAGYLGPDSFTYRANDGTEDSAEATVIIAVGAESFYPGDADLNGVTDVRDFMIWNLNKFTNGTDWTTGDFDGNSVTDVRDFMIWNLHKFTSASDPAPIQAVDEVFEADSSRVRQLPDLRWLDELLDWASTQDDDEKSDEAADKVLAFYW